MEDNKCECCKTNPKMEFRNCCYNCVIHNLSLKEHKLFEKQLDISEQINDIKKIRKELILDNRKKSV